MLTRRNLRNRIIIEKSNEELKKNDKFSTKCKLDDKENQLINPNLIEQSSLKDRKKGKALCSSVLKKSNNKPVRRILSERNNFENSQEKISKPPRNESLCRNYRRQTVEQSSFRKSKLSVLQKTNGSVSSNREKQKRNIKNVKQEDKKDNKPNCKIDSFITVVNQSQKNVKQRNVCKRKTSKIETNVLKPDAKIPIWKRLPNLNKSNNLKKQNSKVDVYDIAQDEELMASAIDVQKKKCHPQKKKVIKKKGFSTKNQFCKSNPSCNTLEFVGKMKAPERDQIAMFTKNALAEKKESDKLSDQIINCFTSDLHANEQDLLLSTSLEIGEQNEILEHSHLDLQSSEPKLQRSKLLSDLADELEKSFSIPKMTSTPDAIHGKTEVQIQKEGILNIADISNIAITENKNITVATPCDSECESLSLKKMGKKETMADITLFESPTKQNNKKKVKSPKKSIQINLFGEIVNSPVKEHNLEDSVLKPSKAYHTPDNFKTHLSRTKRTAKVCENQILKKSKEDILIEKMTQHFEEVGCTELCVESKY